MATKPFSRVHPLARVAVLSTATTLPLLLMLTVFMPRGFSGVPYMQIVILVFTVLFGLVAVIERSLSVNLMIVVVFWSAICIWHLLNPGTAPGRTTRMVNGALRIGLIAGIHACTQAAICYFRNKCFPRDCR